MLSDDVLLLLLEMALRLPIDLDRLGEKERLWLVWPQSRFRGFKFVWGSRVGMARGGASLAVRSLQLTCKHVDEALSDLSGSQDMLRHVSEYRSDAH